MPLSVLDYIGEKASAISRSRENKLENQSDLRIKIRKYVEDSNINADFIIIGHMHVLDEHKFNGSNRNMIYMNNGYFPESKKYLFYSGGEINWVNL